MVATPPYPSMQGMTGAPTEGVEALLFPLQVRKGDGADPRALCSQLDVLVPQLLSGSVQRHLPLALVLGMLLLAPQCPDVSTTLPAHVQVATNANTTAGALGLDVVLDLSSCSGGAAPPTPRPAGPSAGVIWCCCCAASPRWPAGACSCCATATCCC